MDLENAIAMRNRVTRAVGGFFSEYDVLLTPTLPRPPADLGTYNANDPDLDAAGWLRHISSFAAFTPLFNMTGQPAISLPLHHGEAGLPIGSQFVGRFGDEATLFRLAGQLEQAQPWIDRRPAISL
jgi:amidase